MLVERVESDAIMIGNHLADMLFPADLRGQGQDVHASRHLHEIRDLDDEFSLYKLKIFSSTSEVLYSTDTTEVGEVNTHPYFLRDVMAGQM